MDKAELTRRVKAEALRLGFHLVGVTTPEPPESYLAYEAWLEAGRQGEMDYLARERARQRRADPRRILPECRSILVLGIRHDNPLSASKPQSDKSLGRLASYAWGQDYHEALPVKLKTLVAFIEAEVGEPVPNRWYTDTGPILERDLARRAGLGWIAKNSMLINPQIGSYILLAEILLGLELEPDPPFTADHCGTCTRCLEACPTHCILPDRTLDARRCISYLTIELKGPVPADLRPQMGEWVFGCDLCQEVCPWNIRFAPAEGAPEFAHREETSWVNPEDELNLTPEAFNRKFKGGPVKRAKRRGYLRNVAVALGNAGNSSSIPALRQALLHNSEPLVRGHAAWALGQVGGKGAAKVLAEAAEVETDGGVLEEIEAARQSRESPKK